MCSSTRCKPEVTFPGVAEAFAWRELEGQLAIGAPIRKPSSMAQDVSSGHQFRTRLRAHIGVRHVVDQRTIKINPALIAQAEDCIGQHWLAERRRFEERFSRDRFLASCFPHAKSGAPHDAAIKDRRNGDPRDCFCEVLLQDRNANFQGFQARLQITELIARCRNDALSSRRSATRCSQRRDGCGEVRSKITARHTHDRMAGAPTDVSSRP